MSPPRSIAPEPARSGVYRAPERMDDLRTSGALSDGAWINIDLAPVGNKRQLLQVIALACRFPSTFGSNWDALADSLQDMSWWPARAYVLHVSNAAVASARLRDDWAMLLEILRESARYWAFRGTTFIVFVDADGVPDWP
jgi:hypothetical protein